MQANFDTTIAQALEMQRQRCETHSRHAPLILHNKEKKKGRRAGDNLAPNLAART
jgi:hypothetical protein